MKKLLFPALLLVLLTGFNLSKSSDFIMVKAETNNPYLSQLIYEDNSDGSLSVIGVNEEDLNKTSLRIYSYHDELNKPITSIKFDAFKDVTSLNNLMIGNRITNIEENALNISTLTTIYFTGSIKEWNNINYNTSISVVEYSFDEGFINYWNEFVRPSSESSVCDISKSDYLALKQKYDLLGQLDKETVNNYQDLAGDKIKDSMEYMEAYFNPKPEQQKEKKISKDVALGIVIGIAVFGMTSIAIFYLLMKKNIIS